MEDINTALNAFTESINKKEDIGKIQNNLSLLIGQINIYYYKLNFFNNAESCSGVSSGVTLTELEKVSEKLRNIYPTFIELRKQKMKEIYIDKLQCNSNPTILLSNIDRSNKIQSIMSDLSDLLHFNQSDVPEIVVGTPSTSQSTKSKDNGTGLAALAAIFGGVLIVFVLFFIMVNISSKKNE